MSQSNDEVKEFVQQIKPDLSSDNDEVEGDEPVDEVENETPDPSSDQETEQATTDETEEPVETVEEIPKTEPKPVEGETPREKALRQEASRLKGLLRTQRQEDLLAKPAVAQVQVDEDLAGYDPEELKRFEMLAKKMGFAKKDEILYQSALEKNNNEFDIFMEAHPEYAPENDKDGVLWNQFKSEFALYNPPQDPKTLKKVLNKVHSEIYGIQPAANINKINAAREKVKVASHTGASAGRGITKERTVNNNSGLRLDGLKGFTPEELSEYQ